MQEKGRKANKMKCPNSWCTGEISENFDCRVCGYVLRPTTKHFIYLSIFITAIVGLLYFVMGGFTH